MLYSVDMHECTAVQHVVDMHVCTAVQHVVDIHDCTAVQHVVQWRMYGVVQCGRLVDHNMW